MARNESDREDLMAEAVSLIRRIECQSAARQCPTVIGVNLLGWLFVYVGSDLMYRFDEKGRLRRAFVEGTLFRTEGATLAMLHKHREIESGATNAIPKTTLVRRSLQSAELDEFRKRMYKELLFVSEQLRTGVISRQFPVEGIGIVDEMERGVQRVLQSQEFLAPPLVRR